MTRPGPVAAGEFAGFAEFLGTRLPALYRYAVTLTGSPHDAEDLVQEALTRTGAAWPRVQNKSDPEGYIRTTMARIMVNRWRRPKREFLVADPPEAQIDAVEPSILTDDTIDALLAGLPRRMRAVLVLRYVDGMTDEEIAGVLRSSVGTVRSQASRALARLRAAWATGPSSVA